MCVKSATSLSCLVSVSSIEHSPQTYLDGEKNECRMPQGESKVGPSIRKKEPSGVSVWSTSQLTDAIRLYCETSFRSSVDSFSSFRDIFLVFMVGFITNNFAYLSELMSTRFATSLELHQIQSRHQIPNATSNEYSYSSERSFQNDGSTHSSWDSSLSSSTTNDEDNISMNSSAASVSRDYKRDKARDQVEEPLLPASHISRNADEDADEWGHFMDFQEFESLSTTNSLADPFQSISKTFLRRRGAKLSICKLEQLQEEDSFARESE